jgi:hypothetical protein
MSNGIVLNELRQFTGTTQWFRHGLNRKVLYTEGVQYLAEQARAYWLVDEIALAQGHVAPVKATLFQVWDLTVKNSAAALTCEDGNGNTVYSKQIEFTDFPEPGIRFFFADNVLMLLSEY